MDQTTNRLVGAGITYDLNGNMSISAGAPGMPRSMNYDVENRVSSVTDFAYTTESYLYASGNQRLLAQRSGQPDELHFYGADGLLLGVYRLEWKGSKQYPVRVAERERVYFHGRLMFTGENGTRVHTDRLGSVVWQGGQRDRHGLGCSAGCPGSSGSPVPVAAAQWWGEQMPPGRLVKTCSLVS